MTIRSAVVLAAGRGTRMGEMTAEVPKPMLEVRGQPLLEHVLERLAEAGISRFLVVVGYRREMVTSYFGSWRMPIEFRVQDPIDGTGTATLLASDFAASEPFILTFGDILCEPEDYTRCTGVMEDHPDCVAVLGVKEVDDPWKGAAVYEEGGRVTRVIEKPPRGTSTTRWNSAGLFVLSPVAFDYLRKLKPSARGEYEMTAIFDMMLADGLEVRMAPVEGKWRDVGRPEDLAAANLPPETPDHREQNESAGDKHGR